MKFKKIHLKCSSSETAEERISKPEDKATESIPLKERREIGLEERKKRKRTELQRPVQMHVCSPEGEENDIRAGKKIRKGALLILMENLT